MKVSSAPKQPAEFATGRLKSHSETISNSEQAQWSDCSGCKKCRDNGGYVLRRGSWRPTSSWEPILMLAKSDRYFCDGIPVQTPPAAATVSRDKYTRILDDPDEQFAVRHDHETECAGANPRDVRRTALEELTKDELCELVEVLSQSDNPPDMLRLAAQPLKQKHYAAFPTALPLWCLKAGTSARGYCPGCGLPWVRVVETKADERTPYKTIGTGSYGNNSGRRDGNTINKFLREDGRGGDLAKIQITTLGWRPSCKCEGAADMTPRPGRVLDPFAGSGRTGLAANRLGLDFVGVDLNEAYCAMSRKILYEYSPLFA